MLIESREAFYRSQQKSTRRASSQLSIPQTTVRRVVRNHPHLHGYKVRTVQALKLDDKPCRFQFAKEKKNVSNVEGDEIYLSDEVLYTGDSKLSYL